MFEYRYLICTEPIKDKYWTRKIISENNIIIKYEDIKYKINQIYKLIKSINKYQYKKIYNNNLPKIV